MKEIEASLDIRHWGYGIWLCDIESFNSKSLKIHFETSSQKSAINEADRICKLLNIKIIRVR